MASTREKRTRSYRRLLSKRSLDSPYGTGGFTALAPVLSGMLVTPQSALNYAAWFCAVNTVSSDISVLPYDVHERLAGGGSEPDPSMPQHNLIHVSPNGESTAQRFWQSKIGHAMCWGNAFSKIYRDRDGTPLKMELLHPGLTKTTRTQSGQLLYRTERPDGVEILLPENVLHIAGIGFDGLSGYNQTAIGRQAIGLGMATEEHGASFFGNGATLNGILKHPKRLGPAAQNNLRTNINAVHQGTKNAHNFLILEEGMEWQQTSVAPEVSQFLETRQFQVLEIARLTRVPPHKLMDYSQAHLQNLEESNLDYLSRTLVAWLVTISTECDFKLLTEEERKTHFCAHDLWSLLRGAMKDRAEFYDRLMSQGVLTPNMICAMENLNPFGELGDKRFVSANLKPLDQAAEPEPEPEPAPAPEPAK